MEYEVYTIRDVLVGFGPLLVEQNVSSAVRNFRSLSSARDVPFSDFELYRIGTYDTKVGSVQGFAVPELICRGSDFSDGGASDETCKSE